ncbi:MAG: hypothetical protein ACPGRZ_00175 [Alphaproteobacteria bacterium]
MQASDPLTWIFVITVAMVAGLGWIAARGSASVAVRSGAIGLAAFAMISSYAGFAELMSRPKPASLEWVKGSTESARVVASHLRENEAIYLWLVFDDTTQPRAYRLPWNMEMAKQLQQAQRSAAKRKSQVRMNRPFGKDRPAQELIFHAPPRKAPPPKSPQAS